MLDILELLIRHLEGSHLRELSVIPWAAPVLSFGDPSQARIATLGLNPSNREFVDIAGRELDGPHRRFHTLSSLGLEKWSDAKSTHLERIQESCNCYFEGNPYDTWFQALNKLIVGADASYYGMFAGACHLDLVPYATSCKWVELSSRQRSALLETSVDALALLLRWSSVDTLILNGRSVIEHLQSVAGCKFVSSVVPEWTLPRKEGDGVRGYAYKGSISRIAGIELGRTISVLGYSHNIQSSFGVTTKVKDSIRQWIGQKASEVCC